MPSVSPHIIKLDSPIDPFYLSPHTFLTPFGLYHAPDWEKASICATMSSYSINLSNESAASPPSASMPSSPGGAAVLEVLPLSPHTILAALDSHPDIPAAQLRQLVHSLALTIQTRASQHSSQVAGLKNTIADLEESLGQVAEHYDAPPEGYIRNDGVVPDFDVQQDGNHVCVRFIRLHAGDPTRIVTI